jgi:hypothetical protein
MDSQSDVPAPTASPVAEVEGFEPFYVEMLRR